MFPSSQSGRAAKAELPGEGLLPLVYEELRRLAAAKMAREPEGATLQPTALVHEAWLRLGGESQPPWSDRSHFFAAASEAMRRILVDRARARRAQRRGGGAAHVELDSLEIDLPEKSEEVIEVSDALEQFSRVEPQKAELIKLRIFAGLSLKEAPAPDSCRRACQGVARARSGGARRRPGGWLWPRRNQ